METANQCRNRTAFSSKYRVSYFLVTAVDTTQGIDVYFVCSLFIITYVTKRRCLFLFCGVNKCFSFISFGVTFY